MNCSIDNYFDIFENVEKIKKNTKKIELKLDKIKNNDDFLFSYLISSFFGFIFLSILYFSIITLTEKTLGLFIQDSLIPRSVYNFIFYIGSFFIFLHFFIRVFKKNKELNKRNEIISKDLELILFRQNGKTLNSIVEIKKNAIFFINKNKKNIQNLNKNLNEKQEDITHVEINEYIEKNPKIELFKLDEIDIISKKIIDKQKNNYNNKVSTIKNRINEIESL